MEVVRGREVGPATPPNKSVVVAVVFVIGLGIRSFIHFLVVHSFFFFYSFLPLFVHSIIHSFIHSLILSFVHSFIHSFILS